jgi:hypothetical protein
MQEARERVAEFRSKDRQERLARALRENLRRRKTRDRTSTDLVPDARAPDAGPSDDCEPSDSLRPSPETRR